MQRFRFGPDKILHWRRTQVQVAEEKLREANNRVRLERGRVDLVARHRTDLANYVGGADSFDTRDLAAAGAFGELLSKTAAAADQMLAQAQAEHTRRLRAVVEAKRQVELLERLKEKRFSEWSRLAEREAATQAEEAHRTRFLAEAGLRRAVSPDCDD